MHGEKRDGEVQLDFDPAKTADDAALVFIGRIRSSWHERGDAPRNIASARSTGKQARLEIDAPWRPGLSGLKAGQWIIVLYWMDRARRDLIIQVPRHIGTPRGVFSLRSPVRPNPVAMSSVRITDIDLAGGQIGIDAIDCLDNTPLLDIKPWINTIEGIPAHDG